MGEGITWGDLCPAISFQKCSKPFKPKHIRPLGTSTSSASWMALAADYGDCLEYLRDKVGQHETSPESSGLSEFGVFLGIPVKR